MDAPRCVYAVALGGLDGLVHDHGVTSVEAARNGAGVNLRHDGLVITHAPVSKRLAHIAVNLDGLGRPW